MNEICLFWLHILPSLSKHPPCYPSSLLPVVFPPSVLPVPLLLWAPPEWRVLVVALRKQLLTSHFPHPAPITVIISTVSQSTHTPHPSISLSHPSVAWRAVLIDGSSVPLGWRETEGDDGRKRKLFNTSTGKRRSEREGEETLLLLLSAGLHWVLEGKGGGPCCLLS